MSKIKVCIIDALPETRKARELAIKYPGKVFLNFYNASQKGSAKFNEKEMTVSENRTESMDASHYLFSNKINILPSREYEDVNEFATQCSNTAKKLEESEDGSKRYVWIKLGADHYRHADNYATVALNADKNDPQIRWL